MWILSTACILGHEQSKVLLLIRCHVDRKLYSSNFYSVLGTELG
jgi:hypothetical protein